MNLGSGVRPCDQPDGPGLDRFPRDEALLGQRDDHLVDGWRRRPQECLHLRLGRRPVMDVDVLGYEVQVGALFRRGVHGQGSVCASTSIETWQRRAWRFSTVLAPWRLVPDVGRMAGVRPAYPIHETDPADVGRWTITTISAES